MKNNRVTIAFLLMIFLFGSIGFSQQPYDNKLNKVSGSLWQMIKEYKVNPLQKSNSIQPSGISGTGEDIYSVIISSSNVQELDALGININSRLPQFVTARVTISDILNMVELNSVKNIRPGEILYPTNDIAAASVGADLLKSGYVNSTNYTGTGVLTCIIDTGIDWTHPDFREIADQTKSRILYIWDQTLTKTGLEQTPQDRNLLNFLGLNYGVEYSKADIDNEIDGTPAGFVRENDINGHGTHVSGTVAGNGAALSSAKYEGMAPGADIIFIKAGNGSFSSANIINALSYAQKIATQLGKPMVVNMSIGGQQNAHDGTSDQDIAVDNFVGSGRVAIISAGNDGANLIHITGSVSNSSTADINIVVPSYTPVSGSGNDIVGFDLWFNSNGNASATVTTPGNLTVTQNTNTQGTTQTADGTVYLYNFENSNNNDREVLVQASDNNPAVTPAAGTWKLSVTNNSGSSMIYHGWLFTNSMGATLTGGNNQYTVASPGTATSAITVGSYVTRFNWHTADGSNTGYGGTNLTDNISSFSSIGPRRDGVQKPDITAPGQAIISCTSSSTTPSAAQVIVAGKYFVDQGTSMSSPVVAGCVALLLQQNPSLTAAQVKTYLTDNATIDSYTSSVPNYTWGYGKLNIFASMVKLLSAGNTTSREIFAYDQWTGGPTAVFFNQNQKVAVKFTPTFNGKVTGLFFHVCFEDSITSDLSAEIWSDNSGFPGAKIGNTVFFPTENILGNSWNFINMQSSGVDVTTGTNYHAVLYWTSQSGNTGIYTDIGSSDHRSSAFSGSWFALTNDFRIRPVNTISDGSILPVELASFTASVVTNSVKLTWQTKTEVNNYGFEILRSQKSGDRNQVNDLDWEKIGFIKGAGNSNSIQSYQFDDISPKFTKASYRLKQIDNNGTFKYSDIVEVITLPVEYTLEQNYPNPFNPSTTINYSLPQESNVKITLFNILGEKVTDIVNQVQTAGYQQALFNASSLSSGVYYYTIEAKEVNGAKSFISVKKMVVLK